MNLFTKKRVIIFLFVIVAIILFVAQKKNNATDKQETFTVSKGVISEKVSVTGRIKSSKNTDLAFEQAGRIEKIYVDVGTKVAAGQILAKLENDALYSRVLEEEAKLEQLKRGLRPEELSVKNNVLDQSKQALYNSTNDLLDALNSAYLDSQDVVRIKTAGIFNGSITSSFTLSFSPCDLQSQTNVTALKMKVETAFPLWKKDIDALASIQNGSYPQSFADTIISESSDTLNAIRDLIDRTNSLLSASCLINNSAYDSYRANLSLAKTTITAAISNFTTKKNAYYRDLLALSKDQSDYDLATAGTDPQEIKAGEARLLNARSALKQTVIYAPFDGVVTKQDGTEGEIASVNTPLISLIADSAYEIEIDVPETDIAKIALGNKATITLDAYGKDVIFDGIVTKINLSESIVNNVSAYKVTVAFTKADSRIRSGMTANLDIITQTKNDVLYIPSRAIQTKDGNQVVNLITPNQKTGSTTPITVGIRGSDGNIEVTSGLKENDKIIIPNANSSSL